MQGFDLKQPWNSVKEFDRNKNKQLIQDDMRSASSLFTPVYSMPAAVMYL